MYDRGGSRSDGTVKQASLMREDLKGTVAVEDKELFPASHVAIVSSWKKSLPAQMC